MKRITLATKEKLINTSMSKEMLEHLKTLNENFFFSVSTEDGLIPVKRKDILAIYVDGKFY